MALSNFKAVTVGDLIADINAANTAGGTNTITLAANTTFDLTTVDNRIDGPTGLPVIAKKDTLNITGLGGDIIQRDTAAPDFRLFDVASGASLTLQNFTLQNGLEDGSASSAEGGAIYNQGALVLSAATVQDNSAVGASGANAKSLNRDGGAGQDAAGGGIWSSGALTLENGTLVQNNTVLGGNGGDAYKAFSGNDPLSQAGNGGYGAGGGVYVAGGTATLVGGRLSGNVAEGGQGGNKLFSGPGYQIDESGYGGNGLGGGLFIAAGTVELTGVTVDSNFAIGGPENAAFSNIPGSGYGGGIYAAAGTVTLCSDTVESNTTSTGVSLSGTGRGGGIYIVSGAKCLPFSAFSAWRGIGTFSQNKPLGHPGPPQ
jgi:hypothetical protein